MYILVEKIEPMKIGGAHYGNTYHYRIALNGMELLATCERDVAYHYNLAHMPVPEEYKGPYDIYGFKVTNA